MIYFTSDLHFYHEKIIKHTHRPFHTVEEMNKALIKKWNDKISSADEVYILGDFTMKGADIASALLYSLSDCRVARIWKRSNCAAWTSA